MALHVTSVNNEVPDASGNVEITTGGGSGGYTPNLIISTNTETPSGILADGAAFQTALNAGPYPDLNVVNSFIINPVTGFGAAFIEISVSLVFPVLPSNLFDGNTEIMSFSDLGAGFQNAMTDVFKDSTINTVSLPYANIDGDIFSGAGSLDIITILSGSNVSEIDLPGVNVKILANEAGGGGGSQDLQSVTDIGYITTNPILSRTIIGAFDLSTGGGSSIGVDTEVYPGEGLINIAKSATDSKNARIRATNLTSQIELELPNENGTLALSVNGEFADANGNITLVGGGGAPAWGDITGTLSTQTDLQSALDGKQDDITTGTIGQYFRGDLSLATFPTIPAQVNLTQGTNVTISGSYPNLTIASTNTTYTASNGLTLSGGAMQLGGTLLGNTTVDGGAYIYTHSGNNSSNNLFSISNTGTAQALSVSGAGIGMVVLSTGGNAAQFSTSVASGIIACASFGKISTNTNTLSKVIQVTAQTTGTAAAGLGVGIEYLIEASNGAGSAVGVIGYQWDDPDNSTGSSKFIVSTRNGPTVATKLSVNGVGTLNIITADYADNAAALTAGLVAGDVYRTGDFLKIVH